MKKIILIGLLVILLATAFTTSMGQVCWHTYSASKRFDILTVYDFVKCRVYGGYSFKIRTVATYKDFITGIQYIK
jgi:hypothetical protein